MAVTTVSTQQTTPILGLTANSQHLELTVESEALTNLPSLPPVSMLLINRQGHKQLATVTAIKSFGNQVTLTVNSLHQTQNQAQAGFIPSNLTWLSAEELSSELAELTNGNPLTLQLGNQQPPIQLGAATVWAEQGQPIAMSGNCLTGQTVILQAFTQHKATGIIIDSTGQYSLKTVSLLYLPSQLPLKRFNLAQLIGAITQHWPPPWVDSAVTQLSHSSIHTLGGACQQIVSHLQQLREPLSDYLPTQTEHHPDSHLTLNELITNKTGWHHIDLSQLPDKLKTVVMATLLAECQKLSSEAGIIWVHPTDDQWHALKQTNTSVIGLCPPYTGNTLEAPSHIQVDYAWPLSSITTDTVLGNQDDQPSPPAHDVVIAAQGTLTHGLALKYTLAGEALTHYQVAPLPYIETTLKHAAQPATSITTNEQTETTDNSLYEPKPDTTAPNMAIEQDISLSPSPDIEPPATPAVANNPIEVIADNSQVDTADTIPIAPASPDIRPDIEDALDELASEGNPPLDDTLNDIPLVPEAPEQPNVDTHQDEPLSITNHIDFDLPNSTSPEGTAQPTPVPAKPSISKPAPAAKPATTQWAIGQKIHHPRYGDGVIEGLTPTGKRTTLRIRFETVGKRLLDADQSNLQLI